MGYHPRPIQDSDETAQSAEAEIAPSSKRKILLLTVPYTLMI